MIVRNRARESRLPPGHLQTKSPGYAVKLRSAGLFCALRHRRDVFHGGAQSVSAPKGKSVANSKSKQVRKRMQRQVKAKARLKRQKAAARSKK